MFAKRDSAISATVCQVDTLPFLYMCDICAISGDFHGVPRQLLTFPSLSLYFSISLFLSRSLPLSLSILPVSGTLGHGVFDTFREKEAAEAEAAAGDAIKSHCLEISFPDALHNSQ